ncbi:MAG TPA: hypothetical protein DIW36_09115 [Ruminococcaceae bacterium]|nr:hypothetical protein [Oscillospiraceae bacterium]
MINKIVSFFLTVLFAVNSFFCGFITCKRIDIVKCDEPIDYYVDGESENGLIKCGVINETNLFEPNEEIRVVFECEDPYVYGTRVKAELSSEQAKLQKRGYFKADSEKGQYTFSFSSDKNGIFTVSFTTVHNEKYSFKIGVMPENEKADFEFLYGVQPYLMRAKCWSENDLIPGRNSDETIKAILDSAQYLGVNLIREDFVGWGSMQSGEGEPLSFDTQDFLVNAVNERNMKYNWILGCNAGEWSINKKYKDSYVPDRLWTYAPDEELWDSFVEDLADHYADNSDILWEIWNEPNWEFFSGTKEEYFTLLENTAKIIKQKNKTAYVYSGGLAVAERETNSPYYKKTAELIKCGLLDNFGYHNHDFPDKFYDNMSQMYAVANSAGIEKGGINSESGIVGADAAFIARKALYTRSKGADGFVSFSFRKNPIPESDINDFAFFDEYLQPTEAVLAYSTVIRFLGQAHFVGNVIDSENYVADEYKTEDGTLTVYYSFGKKSRIKAPNNIKEAYDMFGNPIKTGKYITVSENPIYVFHK